MNWQVLETTDANSWREAINRLPATDTYFLLEYHRAYELNGDGVAHAFIAEEGNDLLFYPFLVRTIEQIGSEQASGHWQDIETVYGYSGPLGTTSDPAFLVKAWEAFDGWCRSQHIVAEFTRFNPLLENHRFASDFCDVEFNRETVAVRLDCPEPDPWPDFRKSQRTKVRRAQNHGLVCQEMSPTENLPQFRRLYDETMHRAEADGYYYFSDKYFEHLCTALGDSVRIFAVYDGEHLAAATLFLAHGGNIHSHLGGSDLQYMDMRPNNLLVHTVANWGRENGFRWLHLGGGRTTDPDDPIFRFKSSISRQRVFFHVGKRIHDRDAYDNLCAQWMAQSDATERPSHFLMYRLPIPALAKEPTAQNG